MPTSNPPTRLAILVAIALVGCVAPTDGAARSHVRVLTPDEADGLDVRDDELRVALEDDSWAHDVAVGDIVVTETGLLREILAIEDMDRERRLSTQPASLTDALDEMELSQHSGNVYGKADVVDLDLGVHLAVEDIEIHEEGPLTVTLAEASFDSWPTLDVETRMRRRRFSEISMRFDNDIEARVVVDLEIHAEDEVHTTVTRTLYESLPQFYVQWVGVVPIVEEVQTRLIADVEIDAPAGTEATVRIGGQANASFRAGGRYVEGEGIEALELSKSLVITPIGPELLTGDQAPDFVRVSLRPEVEVRFYEVIGLTVGVTAYAEMSHAGAERQCAMDVGLSGDAAVDFTAFGIERSRSTELFNEAELGAACR